MDEVLDLSDLTANHFSATERQEDVMSLAGKNALITGGSPGIGRGIALKLAHGGARVAINYYENEAAARELLAQVQACDSDEFIIQADVSKPEDIRHMFNTVQAEFGSLDIFVGNARPEVPNFFYPPDGDHAAKVGHRLRFAGQGLPVGRTGGGSPDAGWGPNTGDHLRHRQLEPWVSMGAAKAALETLVRYFAVARRPGYRRNSCAISFRGAPPLLVSGRFQ
jgi:enoyl-[acyl-carrier protein] reductase III